MADVIREDIIKISYRVDTAGLVEAQKLANNFGANFKKTTENLKTYNYQFADSFGRVRQQMNAVESNSSFQKLKNDIQTGSIAIDILKDKFNSTANTAKSITSKVTHPFQTLDRVVLQVQMSTGQVANDVKNLSQTKLKNIINNAEDLKDVLTEGKSGAEGVYQAVKNIGKASIGKTVSGFSNLKKGIDNVKGSIKTAIINSKTFITNLKQIDNTSLKKLDASIDSIGNRISGVAKTALNTVKTAAIGIGAALGSAVTKSVMGYADYEQLIGGVDTLFKDSSATIQKYANDAYKTAGLSANTYMETITGFSANLLQSLGGDTQKAAEYGNMAVIDMADNANKMGTDINSIIETYQSLARGNYEMLDNLKLGYGGTKTELQRLIKDAAELDKSVDANSTSYANLVKAIHVVQDNMGITGTTAKEAEDTISGSFSSLRSTWNNLFPSLVQGGDSFNQCMDNLISSAKIFAGNVYPAIRSALQNILGRMGKVGSSIQNVITKIEDVAKNSGKMNMLKEIFDKVRTVADTVATAIGDIVVRIIDFVTASQTLEFVNTVLGIVSEAFGWCKEHIDGILIVVRDVIAVFLVFKATIMATQAAITIYNGVVGFMKTVQAIATAAQWGFNAALLACPLTWIVVAIMAVIAAIVLLVLHWDTIKEVAINVWNKICEVWGSISDWFGKNVVYPVLDFFVNLWNGIKEIFIKIANWVKENIKSIVIFMINPFAGVFNYLYEHNEKFRNKVNELVGAIKQILSGIANWIWKNVLNPVISFSLNVFYFIVGVAVTIWDSIKAIVGVIATWFYANIISPIVVFVMWLWNKIVSIVTEIITSVKNIVITIISWINTYIIVPIINFFVGLWNSIVQIVANIVSGIKIIWGIITKWVNTYIVQPVSQLWNALKETIISVVTGAKNTLIEIWSTISTWINENVIAPVKNFFTGLWDSITSGVEKVKETITSVFQTAYDIVMQIWQPIADFFDGLWGVIKNLINKGKEAVGVSDKVKDQSENNDSDKTPKHALGGLISTRHTGIVAEAGAEMIIPLSHDKRKRAIGLWQQTGQILDVSNNKIPAATKVELPKLNYGEESNTVVNNTSAYGGDNFNFQFEIHIDGTGKDDRELAREMRKAAKEVFDDAMESFRRRNPRITEV